MKQKLALCCALVHKPQVLFLDEPTTGVDPVSRKEFWEILAHLKERNITIIASTPYIDEVQKCERVGFLSDGILKGVGTPDAILDTFKISLIHLLLEHKQRDDTEKETENVIEVEHLVKASAVFML